MVLQAIYNIAEVCAQLGVKTVVLSPGSRCAPLTVAFSRHPHIETISIVDERAAAFTALGISIAQNGNVALVCTSGTAVLNYAPAIAEAYYQQVPLLVFTADRPPEWIDQQDGQTIQQSNVFHPHIKKSFTLPVDTSHSNAEWQVYRNVSDGINIAHSAPFGPVHVNVPIREPFYLNEGEHISFDGSIKTIKHLPTTSSLSTDSIHTLNKEIRNVQKILIVCGQLTVSNELDALLSKLPIPVVSDVMANVESGVHLHDSWLPTLSEQEKEALRPEVLITTGLSVLSKNLKQYLRTYKPKHHWHVGDEPTAHDTFQTLTRVIQAPFESMAQLSFEHVLASFKNAWEEKDARIANIQSSIIESLPWCEMKATYQVLNHIPADSNLHLANSMPIRYSNILFNRAKKLQVFSNRGTSGIDGSMSTAVGIAIKSQTLNTLFIGDLSFFYDRNALWGSHIPDNLRIVLFNNSGGGIFRIIDGPNRLPELTQYFETPHTLTAERTAADFGIEYLHCDSSESLEIVLEGFYAPSSQAKILEITSDRIINTSAFKQYKTLINHGT